VEEASTHMLLQRKTLALLRHVYLGLRFHRPKRHYEFKSESHLELQQRKMAHVNCYQKMAPMK